MLENRLMTLSEVQVVKQGYDEMGLLGAAQEAMSCNVRGEAAGRKRALPPPCLRTPPPSACALCTVRRRAPWPAHAERGRSSCGGLAVAPVACLRPP